MIKLLIGVASLVLFASCSDSYDEIERVEIKVDTTLVVPNIVVEKSKLNYNPKSSLWTLNDSLFSGYVVSYYANDILIKEKMGILNGRRHGSSIHWYPNKRYKSFSTYYKGKLHGEKKIMG